MDKSIINIHKSMMVIPAQIKPSLAIPQYLNTSIPQYLNTSIPQYFIDNNF
jgi:hypothetical protein